MSKKRFTRYLLDGGFSFDDEYVLPRWSILDKKNNKSPFGFLEFEDEYKDICDEICDVLNTFDKENEQLKQWNQCLAEKRHQELQELQNDDTITDLESQIAKLKEEKKELQEALIRCAFDQ